MAPYPDKNKKVVAFPRETPAEAALRAECQRRVAAAEQDRQRHKARIENCYALAMPWRHKFDQETHTYQDDDIYDSTAMTVVEDFAADMLNTFTPMKSAWIEMRPVEQMDAGALNQLREPLARYQHVIFDEMRRSNLYAALQEAYLDLSVGTMALLINDRHPSEPIHCQAVALSDLLIERGPWGGVDGKWRRMQIRKSDVKKLWPDAKDPAYVEGEQAKGADEASIQVTDGVYRDWSDRGNEKWKYVVFAPGCLLYQEEHVGTGSCPYIVARWSRDSKTAWGIGPLYRSLPDVKTLNHVRYLVLKNLDKAVDPPFTYENDGVMNFSAGIEPGLGYARESGSKAPETLESKNKFDVAFINAEQLVHSIKRAHYQDRPEQTGKTPPTATQWADEAAERARRTTATNLVQELQYPIIQRFAYLLEKRGVLPKAELNGKEIQLQPISPLLRAQEQEEVVRIDRFLEIGTARFGPQMMNAWTDQKFTLDLIGERLGVPPGVVRSETQMKAMVGTVAQLAGGGQAPEGTPPGVAAPPAPTGTPA